MNATPRSKLSVPVAFNWQVPISSSAVVNKNKRREKVPSTVPMGVAVSSFSSDDDIDDDNNCNMKPNFGGSSAATATGLQQPALGRRSFFYLITIAGTVTSPISYNPSTQFPVSMIQQTYVANAAETVGKDEACTTASCLGVWDGLFADCPHGRSTKSSCVSSQDDTPGNFAEPWDYSDNISLVSSSSSVVDEIYKDEMDKLILALQSTGDDVDILYQEGRYLRVLFKDVNGEKSIGEFYFTPNDTTVQFRIESIVSSTPAATKTLNLLGSKSLSNMERSERIRKALGYTKVVVLRNRKRAFIFGESELDSFGPSANPSAMLGPPEEMDPGELNGEGRTRRGSDDVDPKLKIDLIESFPYSK